MTTRVEPSNYYWINAPVENIQEVLPRNQKITTRLPANVTLIRCAATAVFAAYLVAKIGISVWAWPVVVVAASFIVYTAVKHLLTKDPLVNAMYTIAGGEREYNALPVWDVIPNKKLFETIQAITWDHLEHPLYRSLTSDGRKVLIVKGYDVNNKAFLSAVAHTQTTLAFVEKLGSYDVPRIISNLHEIAESALDAIIAPVSLPIDLENKYSRNLSSGYYSAGANTVSYSTQMHSSITSEMMNELIQQRKGQPVILPQVELLAE